MSEELKLPQQGEIVIYQSQDGDTKIDVRFVDETVWLTQAQMSKLFQRDRSVISKHINNVFKEGELDKKSNVQNLHIANSDKPVQFYTRLSSPRRRPWSADFRCRRTISAAAGSRMGITTMPAKYRPRFCMFEAKHTVQQTQKSPVIQRNSGTELAQRVGFEIS